MKLNTLTTIVALAGFALVGCQEETSDSSTVSASPNNETAAAQNANVQTVSLKVTGMT